jgi:hypothetical protein
MSETDVETGGCTFNVKIVCLESDPPYGILMQRVCCFIGGHVYIVLRDSAWTTPDRSATAQRADCNR